MSRYEEQQELERYTAELKRLLAGTELSPDTRARSLAVLIEASAIGDAASRMQSAAQTTLGDTMPALMGAVQSFGEHVQTLASALRRLPDR